MFWHGSYITHLLNEIAWYRTQLAHERARAEMAVDELLRLRVQAGPVTPVIPRPSDLVERLAQDPEFTMVGDAS